MPFNVGDQVRIPEHGKTRHGCEGCCGRVGIIDIIGTGGLYRVKFDDGRDCKIGIGVSGDVCYFTRLAPAWDPIDRPVLPEDYHAF